MNLHKIFKILVALFSLIGIIYLILIVSKGDTAIQAAAAGGDSGLIDPMAWVTYIIFALTIVIVIIFIIRNLFTNTATLKSTLIGLGSFVLILLISYFVSGSDTTQYKYSGLTATASESQLVGAGLIAFYILIVGAGLTMLFFGFKKLTK